MSAASITPGGVMTDEDGLEAQLKRTMLEQSSDSLVLLDASGPARARDPTPHPGWGAHPTLVRGMTREKRL